MRYILLTVIALLAAHAAYAESAGDATARSHDFWTTWHTTEQSPQWIALEQKVGLATKSRQAAMDGLKANRQATISVEIGKPQDAAHFIDAAQSAQSLQAEHALATALRMRAAPATVEQAEKIVEPQARAAATAFRADLTSGIPGLPGIYLNPHEKGPSASVAAPAAGHPSAPEPGGASAPAGFSPVAGGSQGCGH